MKKVLFSSHLANFIKFNQPFIAWFKAQGWEVHYASQNEEIISGCDKAFTVCFNRSPYSLDNLKAWSQLKQIIEREQYDIIHCHTPMGGVVTRLSARQARKRGTKVLYTAHGFHFYHGSPLRNWLMYYPVERWLSHYTDCLITMNEEDYRTAKSKKFRAQCIEKIDGVGVDLSRFSPVSPQEKDHLRQTLAMPPGQFILLYIAEFIERKNHRFLIRSLSKLTKTIPNLHVLLAGKGELMNEMQALAARQNVLNRISFLGYRSDIPQLCAVSDVLISVSNQEGLPINIIEGMACGLPIVCSGIRGQTDIVKEGENGYLYNKDNMDEFISSVESLAANPQLRVIMGKESRLTAQGYSLEIAVKKMSAIYAQYM